MINCTSLLLQYLDIYRLSAVMYLNLNIQVYQRCDALSLQCKKILVCLTVRFSKRRGIPRNNALEDES